VSFEEEEEYRDQGDLKEAIDASKNYNTTSAPEQED